MSTCNDIVAFGLNDREYTSICFVVVITGALFLARWTLKYLDSGKP